MLKDYIPGSDKGDYIPNLYAGEDLLEWAEQADEFSSVEVIADRMKLEDFAELLSGSQKDAVRVALFGAFMTEVVGVMHGELGLDRDTFEEKIQNPAMESFRIKVEEIDETVPGGGVDDILAELMRMMGGFSR